MTTVLSLGLIWLAGLCLLPRPRPGSLRPAEVLADGARALGLGAGMLYVVFLAGSLVGGAGTILTHLILGMTVLVRLPVLGERARSLKASLAGASPGRGGKGLLLATALFVGLTAVLTCSLPLTDWDTRILWAHKTQLLTADWSAGGEAFRDPYRLHIHPRYPLLLPALASFVSISRGGFSEAVFQALVCAFAAAALVLLHACAARLAEARTARLVPAIMAVSGVWLENVFRAGVEVVLVFYLLAVLDQFLAVEAGERGSVPLAGLMLFCLASTKNEGILLGTCLLAAFWMAPGYRKAGNRRPPRAALAAAVFLAGEGLWATVVHRIPAVSQEQYLHRLGPSTVLEGLSRWKEIGRAMAANAGDFQSWHVIWLLAPLLLAWGGRQGRLREPGFVIPAAALCGYTAAIVWVYVLSPWRDISMLVEATFDRVMLPVLPLVLLLAAVVLGRPTGPSPVTAGPGGPSAPDFRDSPGGA